MEGVALLRQQCQDILEVDQFDLANASDDVGGRIATYLGLPEHTVELTAFLAGHQEDRTSTHDWGHRLTFDDVAWTDAERHEFERICGPLMRQNGYMVG